MSEASSFNARSFARKATATRAQSSSSKLRRRKKMYRDEQLSKTRRANVQCRPQNVKGPQEQECFKDVV
jgi:hypothetical protein